MSSHIGWNDSHPGNSRLAHQGLPLEEHARVLRDRVEHSAEGGPGFPMWGVDVTDRHHFGAGLVDRRMEQDPDGIDRLRADQDLAGMGDLDKVGDHHLAERDTHQVHPQQVGELRVAHGDMTEQAFGESESAEDAAHPGQSFETVAAFGGNVVEDRSGAGDEPAADRRCRLDAVVSAVITEL